MPVFSWKNLPNPFYCLAPMEGATDAAFRQIVLDCGRPDVCFTEFVNVEGLESRGAVKLEPYLQFDPKEQPLIVQIWGLVPENFYQVSKKMVDRGFAGVDINMGCPDRTVIKKGAGGALINNRPLAAEIIQAVKRGVEGKIPVSVKIRIGYKKIETEEWARFVLEQGIDALTVHGRTVSELSKAANHWEEIEKVVKIRDEMNLETRIIGNGDVDSMEQGDRLAEKSGVDGIMVGRGALKNPWVFNRIQADRVKARDERISLLRKHLDLYEKNFGNTKPYEPLKRFYKIYVQQFPGAVELRDKLMQTKNRTEAEMILNEK